MGETVTKKQSHIEPFLDYLTTQVKDRGVMADLRHGLSRATEYRAWPHIAPWCREFDDDRERRIWLTTAAGFAIHQRTAVSGNMGTVLRSLATGDGRGEKGLETFDARFRRLLACSSAFEVCDHVAGVLRAAERKGVPVNFARLFTDLKNWGEKVKVRWATEYWIRPVEDEAAGAEQEAVTADESEVGEEEEEA
jgi:CRISPR type I-E-associated protein CasB/Cse2